jgi:hypothetical protein
MVIIEPTILTCVLSCIADLHKIIPGFMIREKYKAAHSERL